MGGEVIKLTKDEILTSIVIILLLFTAMVNWNIYSWLIFVVIVIILIAWYFKPRRSIETGSKNSHDF